MLSANDVVTKLRKRVGEKMPDFKAGDPAIYIGPHKESYGEMVFIIDGLKMFYFTCYEENSKRVRRLSYLVKDCFGHPNGNYFWTVEPQFLKPLDNDTFEQERIKELAEGE